MRLTFMRALSIAAVTAFASVAQLGGRDAVALDPVSPPAKLSETGLYADPASLRVDAAHLPFAPQYPLWTDGAAKRRWVSVPRGTAIDASDPEAWVFPVGTRFWKEFSFGQQRVETRYLERLGDGSWLYAAYEWDADGKDAALAPARGRRGAFPLEGGRSHTIPGIGDCKVCHQAAPGEILGFGALQLSSDRDPGALHADPPGVDLDGLIAARVVIGLPETARRQGPRIAARSATERAALGYLHGNCGHCHNERGPLRKLGLHLLHTSGAAPTMATAVGVPVRRPAPGQSPGIVLRIDPGRPDRSALAERIGSRYPALQMPPLGTELVDAKAAALVRRWIEEVGAPWYP